MKMERIALISTIVLGVASFACLVLFFLALTDIWHDQGSPDFWHGEGANALEWRVLGWGYWPMFAFHVLFFTSAIIILVKWRRNGAAAT